MAGAEPFDRRRFLKVVALGAGSVAVAAGPSWIPRPPSAERLQTFPYLGARVIGGPAPRGVPLIPVRVQPDGSVAGVPRLVGVSPAHGLAWYAFCGNQQAPGLRADYEGDNLLRYHTNEAKLQNAERELGAPLWFADRIGEVIRASDFTKVGQGAPFRWRSEGERQMILSGVLIKVDSARMRGLPPHAFAHEGLMAYSSACTHFCCTAGYQESMIPQRRRMWETIYCTCHDAVFDPFDIREYQAPATGDSWH